MNLGTVWEKKECLLFFISKGSPGECVFSKDWESSSVVEHLPSVLEALGPILSTPIIKQNKSQKSVISITTTLHFVGMESMFPI
jgi:hypothetical protein